MGLTIGVVSAWLLRAPRHLRSHIIAATGLGETAAPVLSAENAPPANTGVAGLGCAPAEALQSRPQQLQALHCGLCAMLKLKLRMQGS